jgi:hypothetical protein
MYSQNKSPGGTLTPDEWLHDVSQNENKYNIAIAHIRVSDQQWK